MRREPINHLILEVNLKGRQTQSFHIVTFIFLTYISLVLPVNEVLYLKFKKYSFFSGSALLLFYSVGAIASSNYIPQISPIGPYTHIGPETIKIIGSCVCL